MVDKLNVFSVVFAGEGCLVPDDSEKVRKQAIRNEISVLIPSTRFLIDSVLMDGLIVEGNKLIMQFYLIESRQCQLFQQLPVASRNRYASAIRMLFADMERIKNSAVQTLIRIGDLSSAASILTSLPTNTGPEIGIAELSQHDAALWQLILSQKGKCRQIEIGGEAHNFQYGLFANYVAEGATRFLRAQIQSIGRKKIILSKIREYENHEFISSNGESFPVDVIPLTPKNESSRLAQWGLFYAAYDSRLAINVEVLVALHSHSLAPAYLELIKLHNSTELHDNLDKLFRRTRAG